MELNNILVISGKPDLSEVISQTKNGAIVKNLVTGVKFPVFRNERISSLGEIRIYTTDGEAPLEDVFAAMYKKEDAKPLGFDPKKAENKELFDYFGQVLPNYDTDRVHASDVKKVLHWYNILLKAEKLTPTEEEKSEQPAEEVKEEPKAEKPKAEPKTKKAAAPKAATKAAPKAAAKPKATTKRTTTGKKSV
ncbi:MAG: DUF5606 domain-containing protein [Bacteroidales bacterium]|jgi:hypothetical protein|nr:DUF5606 domain-containing protein [Bacteroidales bacterium]